MITTLTMSGSELRRLRLAAGHTQQEVARLADVTEHTVRLLENGYTPKRSAARERVTAVLRKDDAPAGQGERVSTSSIGTPAALNVETDHGGS